MSDIPRSPATGRITIPAEALEALKAVIEPEFGYGLSDEAAISAAQALLSAWPGMFDVPGDIEFPRKLMSSDYIILPLPQEASDA